MRFLHGRKHKHMSVAGKSIPSSRHGDDYDRLQPSCFVYVQRTSRCKRTIRHRVPVLQCSERTAMCLANAYVYERHSVRNPSICLMHGCAVSLYATCIADANALVSDWPDRLHHANTHIELRYGSNIADMGRLANNFKYMPNANINNDRDGSDAAMVAS